MKNIIDLRREIAELKEEIKHTPKSQEAEGEKKLALKLKKNSAPLKYGYMNCFLVDDDINTHIITHRLIQLLMQQRKN